MNSQLIDGAETLKEVEKFPTYFETPTKPIVISSCGKYSYEEDRSEESKSSLFLKHVDSAEMEGEYEKPWRYVYPGFPGVNPWLDNVVDELHDCDTISLLMAERYLDGLHCLATDHLPGTLGGIVSVHPAYGPPKIHVVLDCLIRQSCTPLIANLGLLRWTAARVCSSYHGMNMVRPFPKKSLTRKRSLDMNCICPHRGSPRSESFSVDLRTISNDDKISLICGASREIIACALGTCIDEESSGRISMNTSGTTRWVLEIAHEVVIAALAAGKWRRGEAEEDEMSDEEIKKIVDRKITKAGIAIVEDVISEAIFHVVQIQGNRA